MAVFKNKIANRTLYAVLGLAGLTVVVVYIVVPLIFLCFPSIMRSFIFVPDEEIPEFTDYKHPESAGFLGAQNFYVTSSGGAKIGVWHTLPVDQPSEAENLTQTVFLYLHGSAGTRTSSHRQRTYRLLNRLGYHSIALDYRGYGDSTGFAYNETDLVEDAKVVYSWIKDNFPSVHIFVWGHSLGTGVAAHLADLLVSRGEPMTGIVLEAPFDNMADAVRVNHLAKIVAPVPWFDHCFIQPLYDNDMAFTSDKHLSNITTPVLILHAKDDTVIPYTQSVKLKETVTSSRKDSNSVELVIYDASLGYGHYNIPSDPHINTTISQFVDKQIPTVSL